MFYITDQHIKKEKLQNDLIHQSAGALVIFEGIVRDTNQGYEVTSLEYQAYIEMAQIEGEKILQEAKEQFHVINASAVHRVGHLQLTDCAVWIGTTAKHRDDAYKANRYIIDQIKLRLPIWKKEHYVSRPAEWVFCKDHHHHVHLCSKDYYSNQDKVFSRETIKSKTVAIVGMGGLGCPAAMSLATSGIGKLRIFDGDVVEVSNLHRQHLYDQNSIGEFKVSEAAKKLCLMSPFCKIEMVNEFIQQNNLEKLKDVDLILDCTDNLATKNLLKQFALNYQIPLISAGIFKSHVSLRSYIPELSSDYKIEHESEYSSIASENGCSNSGVFGAWVNILGHLQASQAIDYLLNGKNHSATEEMHFDLATFDFYKIAQVNQHEASIQW